MFEMIQIQWQQKNCWHGTKTRAGKWLRKKRFKKNLKSPKFRFFYFWL